MIETSSIEENKLDTMKFKKRDISCIYEQIDSGLSDFSGYWEFVFDNEIAVKSSRSNIWYIYFSEGKVVFSSTKKINFVNILEAVKEYVPSLRNPQPEEQSKIDRLQTLATREDGHILSSLKLLIKLSLDTKLIEYKQIAEVVQKHILDDVEQHLFTYSGTINIIADKTVNAHKPVIGFELKNILDTIELRQVKWQKLKQIIPSEDLKVTCNRQNPLWQNLPISQKEKIERLINSGNSLKEIRYNLGESKFKIANIFAQLIEKGLVSINSNLSIGDTTTNSSLQINIAIIDDSLILLKQFEMFVSTLGYTVASCNDARQAVNFLLESPPQIIFLDVNMPHLSGFELIKQIRMQQKLSSIPLVILTAENTMMNSYRAKWSKSTFLTKPLHQEDANKFKLNLKTLLKKMLPSSR